MNHIILSAILAFVGVLFLGSPARAGTWPEDCGDSKTHNFYFGKRSPGDRILYAENIVHPSKFLKKLSYDVSIPNGPVLGRITYIEVLDQKTDGTGGCVYLNGGGVGSNRVTLHVKSARNHGVNFVVNVYGMPGTF